MNMPNGCSLELMTRVLCEYSLCSHALLPPSPPVGGGVEIWCPPRPRAHREGHGHPCTSEAAGFLWSILWEYPVNQRPVQLINLPSRPSPATPDATSACDAIYIHLPHISLGDTAVIPLGSPWILAPTASADSFTVYHGLLIWSGHINFGVPLGRMPWSPKKGAVSKRRHGFARWPPCRRNAEPSWRKEVSTGRSVDSVILLNQTSSCAHVPRLADNLSIRYQLPASRRFRCYPHQ